MAKIKKKVVKHMMSPEEELRNISHSISDQYHIYRKYANVAIAALVFVVAAWLVYSLVRSNNEKQATKLFSAAYEIYAPAGGTEANYPMALQRFQDVVKQYGGTVTGAMAQFYAGNVYMQMGQPEAALKEYQVFVKRHSGEKLLLGQVYLRMGYAYISAGKQDEALKAFGQAEALTGTGTATVELARLYDRMGNSTEAQKKYKDISEKLPTSSWAIEARLKLPAPDLSQKPKPVPTEPSAK